MNFSSGTCDTLRWRISTVEDTAKHGAFSNGDRETVVDLVISDELACLELDLFRGYKDSKDEHVSIMNIVQLDARMKGLSVIFEERPVALDALVARRPRYFETSTKLSSLLQLHHCCSGSNRSPVVLFGASQVTLHLGPGDWSSASALKVGHW